MKHSELVDFEQKLIKSEVECIFGNLQCSVIFENSEVNNLFPTDFSWDGSNFSNFYFKSCKKMKNETWNLKPERMEGWILWTDWRSKSWNGKRTYQSTSIRIFTRIFTDQFKIPRSYVKGTTKLWVTVVKKSKTEAMVRFKIKISADFICLLI